MARTSEANDEDLSEGLIKEGQHTILNHCKHCRIDHERFYFAHFRKPDRAYMTLKCKKGRLLDCACRGWPEQMTDREANKIHGEAMQKMSLELQIWNGHLVANFQESIPDNRQRRWLDCASRKLRTKLSEKLHVQPAISTHIALRRPELEATPNLQGIHPISGPGIAPVASMLMGRSSHIRQPTQENSLIGDDNDNYSHDRDDCSDSDYVDIDNWGIIKNDRLPARSSRSLVNTSTAGEEQSGDLGSPSQRHQQSLDRNLNSAEDVTHEDRSLQGYSIHPQTALQDFYDAHRDISSQEASAPVDAGIGSSYQHALTRHTEGGSSSNSNVGISSGHTEVSRCLLRLKVKLAPSCFHTNDESTGNKICDDRCTFHTDAVYHQAAIVPQTGPISREEHRGSVSGSPGHAIDATPTKSSHSRSRSPAGLPDRTDTRRPSSARTPSDEVEPPNEADDANIEIPLNIATLTDEIAHFLAKETAIIASVTKTDEAMATALQKREDLLKATAENEEIIEECSIKSKTTKREWDESEFSKISYGKRIKRHYEAKNKDLDVWLRGTCKLFAEDDEANFQKYQNKKSEFNDDKQAWLRMLNRDKGKARMHIDVQA